MKKTLLFIINEPTYFVSHRLPIAIAAKQLGYDIHVATGERNALDQIIQEGFTYHAMPLSRSGRNVFAELFSLFSLYRLMRKIKPDLVHLVTIKPVIYGSLAARFARVPAVVAAVSGLGYAFIDQYLEAKLLRRLISMLYRHAFRHPNIKIIFQNTDDQATLVQLNALQKDQSALIHGSGVNLTQYQYYPESNALPLVVVMAARLLRDKGVYEYVAAAKLLRQKGIHARFWLAGKIDPGNPSSIEQKQLQAWIKAQEIEYLGYQQDIAHLFSQAHIVVLPSYREGLPRVLAEAAACGRAVVTTDVPGCRAAIIPGKTGLLANVRDPQSLSDAIYTLLTNEPLRHNMGAAGRQLAEREFDVAHIVDEHLQIYQVLTKNGQTSADISLA